jgi:hypothetical protein
MSTPGKSTEIAKLAEPVERFGGRRRMKGRRCGRVRYGDFLRVLNVVVLAAHEALQPLPGGPAPNGGHHFRAHRALAFEVGAEAIPAVELTVLVDPDIPHDASVSI